MYCSCFIKNLHISCIFYSPFSILTLSLLKLLNNSIFTHYYYYLYPINYPLQLNIFSFHSLYFPIYFQPSPLYLISFIAISISTKIIICSNYYNEYHLHMNKKVVLLSLLLFCTLISYLNMTSTFIILLLTIIIITQIQYTSKN